MAQLILASQSPRRALLLEAVGEKFECAPSNIEEIRKRGEKAQDYVKRLSFEKAKACAWRGDHSWIVLAADTTVVLESSGRQSVLEKPQNEAHAVQMLRHLSGKTHHVFTAYTLLEVNSNLSTGARITRLVKTAVTFRVLSPEEIQSYVESGDPMDKAGAYGAQSGQGIGFIKKIQGSYSSVVGLPIAEVLEDLRRIRGS